MSPQSPVEPGPGTDAATGTSRRWWVLAHVAGIAVILAVHVLGRVGTFCSPVRSDSYVFASFGYRIAHGEVLYRDVSDAKPPGIFLLNAAVYRLGGYGRQALIPIESLFLLLGYFAVYKVGRDLYGRGVALALAIAAALAVNFFLLTDYGTEGFNLAESYMVVFSAGAALVYRRAYQANRIMLLFGAGVLLGLGFVLKQTVLPLVLAVCLHWTGWSWIAGRRVRVWGVGALALLGGACLALLPFVLLVVVQGTAAKAWVAVTTQAADRLTRATAWPGRWDDVMPLWVPMAWAVVGLILWARCAWSGGAAGGVQETGRLQRSPTPADVAFLLIWLGLECLMLVYLPQRAFHYYVLSCLPLLFLSGLIWTVLRASPRQAGSVSGRVVLAAVVIWSIAFVRPAVDTLVPSAIARYRSYDAAADRAFFESALHWGHLDLG